MGVELSGRRPRICHNVLISPRVTIRRSRSKTEKPARNAPYRARFTGHDRLRSSNGKKPMAKPMTYAHLRNEYETVGRIWRVKKAAETMCEIRTVTQAPKPRNHLMSGKPTARDTASLIVELASAMFGRA